MLKYSRKRDWLKLHNYILEEILDKLPLVEYVRFGLVCKFWRIVFLENLSNKKPLLPGLVVVPKDTSETCKLYSLFDKRFCDFSLYMPHDFCYSGCSFGWLIMNKWKDRMYYFQLVNPFLSKNRIIQIPPLNFDPNCVGAPTFRKFVLSCDPITNPDNFVIMGIFRNCYFVFFTPGRRNWCAFERNNSLMISSLIFFNKTKQFYAVDTSGAVVAIEIDPIPKIIKVASANPRHEHSEKYIIESSSGELLQVHKEIFYSNISELFVDKLDLVTGEWIPMLSLGDQTLFLSYQFAICISASTFPACKSNCIYFVHLGFGKSNVMAVFNLENKTNDILLETEKSDHVPIWLEPTISK
ncbi:hypothetical protein ACHQM5_006104 [Ranunculus cassubicifolius]